MLQTHPHSTATHRHGRLPFVSKCPHCARNRLQSGFTCAAVQRLLNGGYPIEAYCALCDEFWPIGLADRVALAERWFRLVHEITAR